MKSKNLKTKLFTTMALSMLVAPTVLGVTPLFDGTIVGATQVEAAGVASASTGWDIAKDFTAKQLSAVTSEGYPVTYYVQSNGQELEVYYNLDGASIGSALSLGTAPLSKGTHTVSGSLADLPTKDGKYTSDTGSVTITVTDSSEVAVKPVAPSNVTISQDGTFMTAVVPQNSYASVVDSSGNEIGASADASYIELSRPLKANETVTVFSVDMNSNLKSDGVSVTFQQAVQEISMEVWYLDAETGKPISEMGTVKGQENTVVSVNAKQIEGYDLLTVSPQMVTVAKGTQVVFEYKKKEVKPPVEQKATLTTKFTDEKGTEISKSVTEEVIVGTTYKAVAKQIEGYTLVDVAEKTGTMSKTGATETFTYKKNEVKPPVEQKATLTTKFTDEKGNEIAKPVTEEVVIGKGYTAKAVTVDGYTLVGQSEKTGTMVKGGVTETFTYKKNEVKPPVEQKATLTTKFVDEKGNEISKSVTEEVVIGKEYKALAKEIKDFDLVGQAEKTGTMVKGGVTETFTYKAKPVTPIEEKATLTTKYVDKSGKDIAKATTKEVIVGESYTTTAVKVDGYKVMGTGTSTGVMAKGGKTETFVYEKEEAPQPSEKYVLTVKYLDAKTMEEIKPSFKDTHEKGLEVTVTAETINGYYVVGDNTQTVTMDNNKTVTFLYNKHEEPTTELENASNVKFVEGTQGTKISAVIPKGATMVVTYDGEIVAETNKSGEIALSKSVATGEEITYYTYNNETQSKEAKLKRTDKDAEQVDFSKLEALVKETKQLDLDIYTKETSDVVKVALVDAEKVLKNGQSTQEEVDHAYDVLEKAVKGLVEKDNTKPEENGGNNNGNTDNGSKGEETGTKTEDKGTSKVENKETGKTEAKKETKDELKKSGKVESNNWVIGSVLSVLGLGFLGFGVNRNKSKKESK